MSQELYSALSRVSLGFAEAEALSDAVDDMVARGETVLGLNEDLCKARTLFYILLDRVKKTNGEFQDLWNVLIKEDK